MILPRSSIRETAEVRDPIPAGRKGPASPVENAPPHRGNREEIQGIRPPDSLHGVAIGLRSRDVPSVREQEPEIVPNFFFREIPSGGNSIGAQGGDPESPSAQGVLPEDRPPAAEAAGIIVENPTCRDRPGLLDVGGWCHRVFLSPPLLKNNISPFRVRHERPRGGGQVLPP